MNGEYIFALDIGAERVKALAAERTSGLPAVRGTGEATTTGYSKGTITDTEALGRSIKQAVDLLSQSTGGPVGPFSIAISGSQVEVENAQGFLPLFPSGRAVTRDDVLQVINHSRQTILPAGIEQIQALPREFRIDTQRGVQRPVGMAGSKLEVVTVLINTTSEVRNALEQAAKAAGIEAESFVYGPLASGMGVLRPEDIELGCIVIDIGADSSDVAVFVNGALAQGTSVPLGGRMVSSDVSKLLKTSLEEADRLKIESGAASSSVVTDDETVEVLQLGQTHLRPMQRKVLCEIIQSRIREIATLVKQQLEAQKAPLQQAGGIILTGGTSRLPGIEKVFEEVFAPSKVRIAKGEGEMARVQGLARFAADAEDDELAAAGSGGWKDRIRTFWSLLGGG